MPCRNTPAFHMYRMKQSPECPDPNAAAQVYYDGGCPVCTREISLYQRLCGKAGSQPQFLNVADQPSDPATDLTRADALARFHVRRGDGVLVSGANAFLALWRATPGLKLAGRMLSIPPLPWLLEFAYRGFLNLRALWR